MSSLHPGSNFLAEEGLKDKLLDSELIPVQKAVVQLAKSGRDGILLVVAQGPSPWSLSLNSSCIFPHSKLNPPEGGCLAMLWEAIPGSVGCAYWCQVHGSFDCVADGCVLPLFCTAGSQLESGDLKGASATLSSGWVEEFKRATQVNTA